MLKKRIIPVILLKDGKIVQSRQFSRYSILGDPTPAVKRISSWSSDELIYLDISCNQQRSILTSDSEILLRAISESCTVPLTFGGGIRTLMDASWILKRGADKITINTSIYENPGLIGEIASVYGSQCVVASLDVKCHGQGVYEAYCGGISPSGSDPVSVAKMVERLGAGEILLNSMDRDGSGKGFDIELINQICDNVSIPVIALGGAGCWSDFTEVLIKTQASAVAAANLFQHSENSVYQCRAYLYESGHPVRKPQSLSEFHTIL